MRSIAGQISKFDFSSVSANVSDPKSGSDVSSIVCDAWRAQIGGGAQTAAH